MIIEQIQLHDFRSYEELTLNPHPGVNLLFGPNGSGKTNVLEAIHYCALGRSHRTSQDREVVRRDREAGSCGVRLNRGGVRTDLTVRLTPEGPRKKQVSIDGKRVQRLSDLMGRVQCVIFSPEDLQLIKEGPSQRRRFVDMMLSQLSPAYFIALQRYSKALEQRGAILREARRTGQVPQEVCAAFEQAMGEASAVIIPLRRQLIAETAEIAVEKYAHISDRAAERFEMAYQPCVTGAEDIATAVCDRLRTDRALDVLRGVTGFGVHREDLTLTLEGREMKQFASQGQIRTAALSMKLAQLELFRRKTGEMPILMLDDVMSELDKRRRTHLLSELSGVQTFVTCTDESDLDGCDDRRTYLVSADENGRAHIRETRQGEPLPVLAEEEPDFT